MSVYLEAARMERDGIATIWPFGFPCGDGLLDEAVTSAAGIELLTCGVEGCDAFDDLKEVVTSIDGFPFEFAIPFCGRHAAIFLLSEVA